MTTYTAASGSAVYGGRVSAPSVPAWVASTPQNTWHPLTAPTFLAGATSVIPSGAYRGTNPFGSILDAYGDLVLDPITGLIYFFGGGHGDGSCNAVLGFNPETLSYFLECAPTAPAEYPPNFLITVTPASGDEPDPYYAYPSGARMRWHKTLAQLPAPADQPYAASVSKPIPTHQYGAQAVRAKAGVPRRIHCFYNQYKVYDLDAHAWTTTHELGLYWIIGKICDRLEAQTPGSGNSLNRQYVLQQGTVCVYDAITDKYFVSLVGGGFREGFFIWDPATEDCTKVVTNAGFRLTEAMPMLMVGRWVYCFCSSATYPNVAITRGYRYNMDTAATEFFSLSGQTISYELSSSQEGAPAWYSASTGKIALWNHNATDRQNIYEVDVAAFGTTGGAGTVGNPYTWVSSKRALAGTAPGLVSYKYNGVMPLPGLGVALLFSHSTSAPHAIRL